MEGDAGYTEENSYGILGLSAAAKSDPAYDFQDDIDIVWKKNLNPVTDAGYVWWNAAFPGSTGDVRAYVYAGEYLQALAAAVYPGDLNLDDQVNLEDVANLSVDWLRTVGCDECSVADLNHDRKVDLADVALLAQGWLLSRP